MRPQKLKLYIFVKFEESQSKIVTGRAQILVKRPDGSDVCDVSNVYFIDTTHVKQTE